MLTLQGLRPAALGAPIAIALYSWIRRLGITELSYAPPPLGGQGWREGGTHVKQEFSS